MGLAHVKSYVGAGPRMTSLFLSDLEDALVVSLRTWPDGRGVRCCLLPTQIGREPFVAPTAHVLLGQSWKGLLCSCLISPVTPMKEGNREHWSQVVVGAGKSMILT